ncbi:hypothetical protein [Aeromonas jandaei]|uniref:hypothetical protein n=1 Tax=Aeromonas jandaei TaxID=650 RepID=UPI002AA0DB97|nr:hypothetical protein [Aeromonas jandaei]
MSRFRRLLCLQQMCNLVSYIKPSWLGVFLSVVVMDVGANSVSRDLVVGANITVPVFWGDMNVVVEGAESVRILTWNEAKKSFDSVSYDFNIEVDSLQQIINYSISLDYISFLCISHNSEREGVSNTWMPPTDIQWSNGEVSSLTHTADAKSPSGLFRVSMSERLGRDVQVSGGRITFHFPRLSKEFSSVGGSCDANVGLYFQVDDIT